MFLFVAVFGGLDLHGKDKGLTWTKLASTAQAGANQIVLSDAVGWEAGDDIVLGPTSYNAWETESFRITAIGSDNKTLTLNDTLRYKHISKYFMSTILACRNRFLEGLMFSSCCKRLR